MDQQPVAVVEMEAAELVSMEPARGEDDQANARTYGNSDEEGQQPHEASLGVVQPPLNNISSTGTQQLANDRAAEPLQGPLDSKNSLLVSRLIQQGADMDTLAAVFPPDRWHHPSWEDIYSLSKHLGPEAWPTLREVVWDMLKKRVPDPGRHGPMSGKILSFLVVRAKDFQTQAFAMQQGYGFFVMDEFYKEMVDVAFVRSLPTPFQVDWYCYLTPLIFKHRDLPVLREFMPSLGRQLATHKQLREEIRLVLEHCLRAGCLRASNCGCLLGVRLFVEAMPGELIGDVLRDCIAGAAIAANDVDFLRWMVHITSINLGWRGLPQEWGCPLIRTAFMFGSFDSLEYLVLEGMQSPASAFCKLGQRWSNILYQQYKQYEQSVYNSMALQRVSESVTFYGIFVGSRPRTQEIEGQFLSSVSGQMVAYLAGLVDPRIMALPLEWLRDGQRAVVPFMCWWERETRSYERRFKGPNRPSVDIELLRRILRLALPITRDVHVRAEHLATLIRWGIRG